MNTLKVAYIGNFEPEYSTENDVRKAFEYLGHNVLQIQENKVAISDVREHVLNSDMMLITGTWDLYNLGDWLDIIHECAKRGIPTATIHLDTFWGTARGGRKWWQEPMFHTAYIFTADGDYQKEWELMGKNHTWLPPAVRHDAIGKGQFKEQYACDVAFVGSNGQGYHEDVWNYRKELVDNLREMCRRNGWSFKNIGGDLPKIERSDEMNHFYASAKVTVGDSLCLKKEDSQYWSDRVPEATGRGGFLIMPEINALKEIWEELPMYKWGDWNDLENKIRYYLENEDEREKIRNDCMTETEGGHTYVDRVQRIIDLCL